MGDFEARLQKIIQLPLLLQFWAFWNKSLKLLPSPSNRWRDCWSKMNYFPWFSYFRRGGDKKIDCARIGRFLNANLNSSAYKKRIAGSAHVFIIILTIFYYNIFDLSNAAIFQQRKFFSHHVVYLKLDSSLKVTKPDDAKLDDKIIC